jgi:glutamine amidotransferase
MSDAAIDGSPLPSGQPSGVRIAVVDYGAANLLSITRALEAVGAAVTITSAPDEIAQAAGVVLPGVGAAGAAMANLRTSGVDEALRTVAGQGRPLLGLCLGMQLFFETLEEDDARGLGILPGAVRLLPPGRKIPHMGWNALAWTPGAPGGELFSGLEPGIYAYFVHSYACIPADPLAALAWTDYGVPVLAAVTVPRPFKAGSAIQAPHLWGLQFHPEKSGASGLRMLANWVAFVRDGTVATSGVGATDVPQTSSGGRPGRLRGTVPTGEREERTR